MKTILVTGANGQLGKKIQDLAPTYPNFNFIYTDKIKLDITDAESVRSFFQIHKPKCVINCAAYTQVDKAEEEYDIAYTVNAKAPEKLAQICEKNQSFFIHVSTDYVYGNVKQNTPIGEDTEVSPNSVYGKTKAEGEKRLKKFSNTTIVRTAWLYSEYGNNFLKTMLRLGKERDHLNVVYDQISSPTYAGDLADALLKLAQKETNLNEDCEILHYTNEGVCSWYDFAYEIFSTGKTKCKLSPIKSSQYPTPAKRPAFSLLDKTKIKEQYGITIPDYRDGLKRCMAALDKLQM